MHNWLEGVLMHHFRERWGFQTLSFKGKRLRGESGSTSRKRPRLDPGDNTETMASNRIPDEDNEGNNNDDDGDGDDDGDDDDAELDQGPGGLFSTNEMEFFRLALAEVVLPTSVGCLPSQLGNAKCGKLKASQWYTLFVYVIPLIVADIFVTNINRIVESSNRALIMENIACLIQCTHIVNSRRIKDVHRKRFEDSYERYTLTSQKIFQHLSILPNHHYALHVPQQQELWGPLGEVAEFTGERMIGKLGEIRTNNRLGKSFFLDSGVHDTN
jgi:hypothetical protein